MNLAIVGYGKMGRMIDQLAAEYGFTVQARIDVNDVARGVAYMASLSLEANVQFMTVMATKMPYIGRG